MISGAPRLLELGLGLPFAAKPGERLAQVVVGPGVGRPEPRGLAVLADGLLHPLQPEQRVPEVEVGLRKLGIEAQRAPVLLHRILEPA